ncbi:PilZ domain-containing protein [Altererythrobacter sp. KTW20L]|uniref:PilZ domain-containing protein n=1 Tax=Altererythrobacter sp. KTW20L TaxID=2942210 RepID=UPI0020BE6E61|nr:PilZ domain-containing protein [Altererythrobacter sp. KTW20L]MCL6249595.1 PilZ domain-containing protein [Altererythrobacter sp. KTW20L]
MPVRRIADLPSKLLAKCRFSSGSTSDLEVLDLSHGGCMIDRKRANADPGARVLVKLPGLASQAGEVVWVEDERAGIAFEQPLHEAVLEHLWQTLSASPKAA